MDFESGKIVERIENIKEKVSDLKETVNSVKRESCSLRTDHIERILKLEADTKWNKKMLWFLFSSTMVQFLLIIFHFIGEKL